MKDKILKKSKFKNVLSVVLFVIALFFLFCVIIAKVKAADEDVVTYALLDVKQYNTIISLLTVTAVSSVFNSVITLTSSKRKG